MEGEGQRAAEATAATDKDAVERAQRLVGTVISERYRIHNVLAMGGMGAVFTGEHVHMRKRVAIKILHPDTEGLPGLVARFEREAIVGAHVEHPNVASARDFGRLADGSYYLVLEFVRGVTLHQLIRQGPMPPARAVRLAKDLAAALAAVHGHGIVHRDVKPRNVMVVPGVRESVKLIDFGFAKVPVERFAAMSSTQGVPFAPSTITADGVVFGTIGYLAPEAALGMGAVDARSDLYALGVLLFEMLAGVPPFEAEGAAALFLEHRLQPVPAVSDRAPGVMVPPAIQAIVKRLLAKVPGDRFGSAEEVVRALDDAAAALLPESRPGASAAGDAVLELTVAGAQPPASQPRYEDVAEGTPGPSVTEERAQTETSPPPRSVPFVSGAPRRKKRPWIAVASVAVSVTALALGLVELRRRAPAPASPADPTTGTEPAKAPPAASTRAATSPTAAATGTAAADAAPREVDGLDAEAWRRVLRQAPSTRDYSKATSALLALAELDPASLASADLRSAAVDVAVNAGTDARMPNVIDALGQRFGTDGLDVLYDIVTKRGGSRTAALAGAALARPEVRARGTKAFRIAIELREAPCADKPALLERARADGDARAVSILLATRSADCAAGALSCCLRDNAAVESVIRDLLERTRAR